MTVMQALASGAVLPARVQPGIDSSSSRLQRKVKEESVT